MSAIYRFVLFLSLALSFAANAQNSFSATEAAKSTAEEANATILAPKSYAAGLRAYEKAVRGAEKGDSDERIGKYLGDAKEDFVLAREVAELNAITLKDALDARKAAATAAAAKLASDDWIKANDELARAIKDVEKDRVKAAREKGLEARELFRTAELNAIRVLVLGQAKAATAEAERRNAEKYAPQTFAKAQRLLAGAETALIEDRYELEPANLLALEATQEAQHSILITETALEFRQNDITIEGLSLRWEQYLLTIASALGVKVTADTPPETAAAELALASQDMLAAKEQADNDVENSQEYIAALEEEIRVLDKKLGGASAARTALTLRLESQARVREQFQQVEDLFGRDEALILREGDNVLIRLVGMQFSSGSSDLDDDKQLLLDQVDQAIRTFPRCEVDIEGHTDSSGSGSANLVLSKERADAVMKYLVYNKSFPAHRIQSFGFGKDQPIALNETEAGKARNRRIDVLIKPQLDSGAF
ncbi:MAG: OmpA family protein [Gammaproteobacteria bacterium]